LVAARGVAEIEELVDRRLLMAVTLEPDRSDDVVLAVMDQHPVLVLLDAVRIRIGPHMRDRHRRAVVLRLRSLIDRVAIGLRPARQELVVLLDDHAGEVEAASARAELPDAGE